VVCERVGVTTAAVTFAGLVLAYALVARRLGRLYLSPPLVFVAAGTLLGVMGHARSGEQVLWVKAVAEATLALVLFHDAAQVRPADLRAVGPLVARLLLVAWPLTVLAGYVVGRAFFPEQPTMLTLLVAAALAPTDAGLSAAVLLNRVVPVRVRAMLNVESGLNDGLATPVVLFAIVSLAGEESLEPAAGAAGALLSLGVGAVIGLAVGVLGGRLLAWSRRAEASTAAARTLGVFTLPMLAYGGADLAGGNGFVAAFVAGAAFGASTRWIEQEESAFGLTEASSELLGLGVWLVFGLVVVAQLWGAVGWREVAYALLSLSVLRMVPVALSLIGGGLRLPTVLFLGWFGPRGLATVVFALLATESLEVDETLREALLAVSLTVLFSVVAHGATAQPLAERYGRWSGRQEPSVELGSAREPRPRGTLAAKGRP
jgi:NhaP-type Na+/H+ or K+/H+ antiporter